ncbi:hypothetical protein BB427_06730 [Pseudoalteromonas sp. BMB]|uniref:hypothetical protein n=1 Tax=Pseudoalteromonas sp. BMB TaxID=1874619 RepID=UPI00083DDEAD|nr:hypothetical protein [Pseudoalteromonas sp. BMB]ODB44372.1 hypothetical protein BB427_06730 [Pseudoalteromonas sp. BMB]
MKIKLKLSKKALKSLALLDNTINHKQTPLVAGGRRSDDSFANPTDFNDTECTHQERTYSCYDW